MKNTLTREELWNNFQILESQMKGLKRIVQNERYITMDEFNDWVQDLKIFTKDLGSQAEYVLQHIKEQDK